MEENKHTKYIKVYDKRKRQFGVKLEKHKEWYIEPCFDEMGLKDWGTQSISETWFLKDGLYGRYDLAEKKVLLPAEYGFPFYFNKNALAVPQKI